MKTQKTTGLVRTGPALALQCAEQNVEANFATPAQQLKAQISFRALVASDGQKLKQTGKSWSCRCPFHADSTPSFHIWEQDDHGKCFGCDWFGDVYRYVMDRTGCDFRTAFDWLTQNPTLNGTRTKTSLEKAITRDPEYQFTEAELESIERTTGRLQNEEHLLRYVAESRNWKLETIKRLAEQKHLGWGGDSLDFIYKTGIKIRRWPERDFRWDVGKPYIWRADKIPAAQQIFVTEGEPDAITLLDAGLEERAGVAVVALPSANTSYSEWAELFTGKDVVLCLDMDEAGQKGTQKFGGLLLPFAKSVSTWDPKEAA